MVLRKDNIISYLISNGFTNCKVIQIRNLRNFCAVVETNKGNLFIKQEGRYINKFSFISLISELKFYSNDNKDINDLIPNVYHIDYKNSIIIIEFLSNFNILSTYDESNFFQSKAIGRSLALIHQSNALVEKVDTYNYFRFFNVITPEAYNAGGRLFAKCVELMQRFPDLNEALIKFEQEFVWDCFIHGDLKIDNFLVFGTDVKFIDWELSGFGDRHLDLGSIIGNYVLFWIEKMSFDEAKNTENDNRLKIIKEHIFLFLSNYREDIKDNKIEISYEKIVKFAGIFLLNVFYSKSVFKSIYSKQDIMVLEYGRKMLVFPYKFTIELFLQNIIEQNARIIK